VYLKRQFLVKKMMKTESKSTINRDAILVQRMILRTNSAPADQSVTDKQTPYFRTHTAGARITIFSKLCMVIEDVERIIKGDNHFSIPRIFLSRGCKEKLGVND